MVYDIGDLDSFKNLNSWLIEIEKNANKNVYKLLIGNKNDIEPDKRQVTYEQGKEFADMYGMKFIETSAKTNTNVSHSFELMSKDIIDLGAKKPDITTKKPKLEIKQGTSELANPKKSGGGCC